MKHTVIHLPETDSTNNYAIKLLEKNRPEEGCVIITGNQTKGKGLDTNTWESEKDMNLTFSVILYPTFTADRQFLLNKAISLGIYDFLVREIPTHRVSIKWPNDIYIEAKKACGILIQNSVIGNRFDYVVVGIGLNVNQMIFTSNAPNPVSMKMVTGIDYNMKELLQKLLNSIFKQYERVKTATTNKIENEYHSSLYRMMEWHDYQVKGEKIEARITGTNAYGQLLLETEKEQVIICDLKEIKFME